MAKPKTRSESVGFRLPVALWDDFTRQAAAQDLTPGQYAELLVRRGVQQASAAKTRSRR